MTHSIRALSLLVALTILPARASADWVEDYTRYIQRTVRDRVSVEGDAAILALIDNASFEVDAGNPVPSAYAGNKNGKQVIGITPALTLLIFYFAELAALNVMENGKWEGCSLDYSAYVRDAYTTMVTDVFNHQTPQSIRAPETFGGRCSGLKDYYPFSGDAKKIRDQMASNALGTIYLHEVGHLYYRDVANKPELGDSGDSGTMRAFLELTCHQRSVEARADSFAVAQLFDLGWPDAAFDVTIWTVMNATGSIDPSLESISDHPSPTVRMVASLNEARTQLQARGGSLNADLDQAINDAARLQKKIEEKLPLFEFDEVNGYRCGG